MINLLTLTTLIGIVNSTFKFKEQTQFYQQFVDDVKLYSESGYIGIENKMEMFYHLFLSTNTLTLDQVGPDDTLILWLNGGPGQSSILNIFDNIGPYRISYNEQQFELESSEYSWSKLAHILFLDQPVGAGFSYSTDDVQIQDSHQAAQYVVKFLQEFIANRPQFIKTKFYIFGVSYAGHYIPALAQEIFKQQLNMNYQGIGIGNGWVDPFNQFQSYSSTLHSLGIMDNNRAQLTQNQMATAQQYLINDNYPDATNIGFYGIINIMNTYSGSVSQHDFQEYDQHPQDEYTLQAMFFKQYKSQFEVPENVDFQLWNHNIRIAFQQDISHSYIQQIDHLLTIGKVLIYNGQLDIICNTPGVNNWINQLKWDKIYSFKQSNKQVLYFNENTPYGTIKSFDNLTYITLYKAGHMAPRYQGKAALEMLKLFL